MCRFASVVGEVMRAVSARAGDLGHRDHPGNLSLEGRHGDVTTNHSGQRPGEGEHVRVRFELGRDQNGWRPTASETLWAAPTGVRGHYRIDNIPFFAVDVSVGDVVLAEAGQQTLEFVRVCRESGHRSVALHYRTDQVRSAVETMLTGWGCRVERGENPKVLAVDIPASVSLDDVTAYLTGMEELGELSYYENDVGSRPTPPRRWRQPCTPRSRSRLISASSSHGG